MNRSIPALMRGEQAASIQDCGAIIQPGKRTDRSPVSYLQGR